MNPQNLEHLRQATGDALDRYARTRAESERRGDQPPQPGEIFAFGETAALGVLWAVLERHPRDAERFLVVAADLHLVAGSADVAVPAEAAGGAMSLRCGLEVCLPAPSFAAARRSGFLEPETLARARHKRAARAAETTVGSALEQEIDAVPEYQDRIAELEQARRTLAASWSPEAAAELVERTGFFTNVYALAASVLLVVTLGLAAGVGWQHLELSRLEGEQQALDTARREQRRKHQQEQQRATQELRKRKAQQRQDRETIAELEQRLQASAPAVAEAAAPVVNLAFALFTSVGAVRGEAKTVTVPPATRFLLILEVSEVFPVYRLEIRKQDIGTPVWESSELTRTGRRELTVLLPRSLFPDDQYQLRLAGLRDGRAVPLEEYLLRLASP